MIQEWQRRPVVFQSTQRARGRSFTQSAVNWRKVLPSTVPGRLDATRTAWESLKSVLGYVSWDNVAKKTHLPVEEIAAELKYLHESAPGKYLAFTVDRMGNGTYFKFKGDKP